MHIMSTSIKLGASATDNNIADVEISEVLPFGTWHHIAIVRSETNVYLFINGTKKGTMENSLTTNDKLVLGHLSSAASGTKYKGYMDELRVSNVARWTTDFTPPEEPYGKITIHTETKLIKKRYTDWQEYNLPWISEINRIRANYNALVRLFLVGLGLPVLADSNYLAYQEVNNWEHIASAGKTMFENMEQEYRYCGVEESGGDRLL